MSKKAEERALECYPVYEFFSKDINRRDRNIFLQGYEQAEKELKLTWEDMKAINDILETMTDQEILGTADIPADEEQYYKEALRRYESRKR